MGNRGKLNSRGGRPPAFDDGLAVRYEAPVLVAALNEGP